jgi:hypothetical protein
MYEDDEMDAIPIEEALISTKGQTALELTNQTIKLLEASNETEALEIIACLSTAYSSARAGYIASGLAMGSDHVLKMMQKIEVAETETFHECLDDACVAVGVINPLAPGSASLQ